MTDTLGGVSFVFRILEKFILGKTIACIVDTIRIGELATLYIDFRHGKRAPSSLTVD